MSTRNKDTENFPVGSWLVAAPLRPVVHAYYLFAREADDISDNPRTPSAQKVALLDEMDAQLQGEAGEGKAANARRVLMEHNVSIDHCRDLLVAFKRDSVKARTQDWADLMEYCRYSASPVGRFLLDLHGESRDTWGPGDALCNALQVLNHLQDCGDDYRLLDRVYFPQDWLTQHGGEIPDLAAKQLTPALRRVMDQMLDGTETLMQHARQLPPMVKNSGLRREVAVIIAVAERLLIQLRHRDPLAERVKLSKAAYAAAMFSGLARTLLPWGLPWGM